MKWNWQQPGWPEFTWKQALLLKAEALFLVEAGEYAGAARHRASVFHLQYRCVPCCLWR